MALRRYFNTEGQCEPNEHYMVRIEDRLEKIKSLYVDRGKYFIINRGRQYGKTTTLRALAKYLEEEYVVFSMDFQRMSVADFAETKTFVVRFIAYIETLTVRNKELMQNIDADAFCGFVSLKEKENLSMDMMFAGFSRICETSNKPVVLIIDEVDSASNNQVFIDFLATLRSYYLDRENCPIFRSVILAGVYDVKNLKSKIRPDSEHQYNSPWNIAAKFTVDMSFSIGQIAAMLREYEEDNRTGMDVDVIAEEIYLYTSGYPYLVSALCKIMDEELPEKDNFVKPADIWTKEGVAEAAKFMLNEKIPLFGSMIRHISEYPELKKMLYLILFCGEHVAYNVDNPTIDLAGMFGYVRDDRAYVQIANRIFEMRLYNFFLSEEELASAMSSIAKQDKNRFIAQGRLNMDFVLERFVEHFHDIYGENDEKFVEKYGRKFFLLYLKPIINGTGNYYVEAQTRDAGRTDVIVDYAGEQFVVELKIWRGNEYNERGEEQLIEYLDYFHKEKGYLLSFHFNKKKEIGIKTITVGNKTVVEAVV